VVDSVKKFFLLFWVAIFAGSSFVQPAGAADNSQYIVGTWNTTSNGSISVSGTSGFYEGTVTKSFIYNGCEQKVGDVMIKILGNGSGSLLDGGIALLGSFQANIPATNCGPSMATAEFKLTKTTSVFAMNTCPTWGGECIGLTKADVEKASNSPKITFQKDTLIATYGSLINQVYWVTDDSPKISVMAKLYSDGKEVWPGASWWSVYSGDPVLMTFQPPKAEKGPFYICVVARDADGNQTGEFDNCYWRSIEASIDILGNGCGRQLLGAPGTALQNALIDEISYPIGQTMNQGRKKTIYFKVNVRAACQNHDAGYQGATFKDQVTGKYIDTRLKPRAWVDKKFKDDIIALCIQQLKKLPEKNFLDTCKTGPEYRRIDIPLYLSGVKLLGATTYATAVATEAKSGYDTDSTKIDTQDVIPKSTAPAGGSRSNLSDPKILYNKKKK
jgi:hypothetical protein